MKLKLKIFITILALFIFSLANSALALEVKYPHILGLPDISKDSPLSMLIKYYFGFFIYIAGILSVISFVIGAIGLLSPSVESHSNAKDRMKGSILGLFLTLCSFIILQIINPSFISPGLTPTPAAKGLFYSNGTGLKPAPDKDLHYDWWLAQPDLDNGDYKKLRYCCTASDASNNCPGGSGPALLVWKFPKPGLENPPQPDTSFPYSGIRVERLACGGETNLDGFASFKTAPEKPGVYLCLGPCDGGTAGQGGFMCAGYMSEVITTLSHNRQEPIDPVFAGNIYGVRIVNTRDTWQYPNYHYGVVFHKTDPNHVGKCTDPIVYIEDDPSGELRSTCLPVPQEQVDATKYADIINVRKENVYSAYGEVYFYSEPYSDLTTKLHGKYIIQDTAIASAVATAPHFYSVDAQNMAYLWPQTIWLRPEYKDLYPNFQAKSNGSIVAIRNYLIGVYTDVANPPTPPQTTPNPPDWVCKTYNSSVYDLNNDSPQVNPETKVDKVIILPTQ